MNLTTPCIETTHARDAKGYGKCAVKRFGAIIRSTHRLAWVDHHGRLPAPGKFILHHCDNPPCMNVEHLYEGTIKQNSLDMVRRGRLRAGWAAAKNKAKTRCPQGHEYTPENTYIFVTKVRTALGGYKPTTKRYCLTCRKQHDQNSNARRTARAAECRVKELAATTAVTDRTTWPLTAAQKRLLGRLAEDPGVTVGAEDVRSARSLIRRGLARNDRGRWTLTDAGNDALAAVKCENRGICPACGRSIQLLADGVIGPHGNRRGRRSAHCPGHGKRPTTD